MLKDFVWLLTGYFAVIGLIRVTAMLADRISPPRPPRQCRLYLQVPEDADYTESGLVSCHRLLRRGETGSLPYAVLLPQNGEAREICLRYCRDWHIEAMDLLPEQKRCMIGEKEAGKDGEPQNDGAGMGKDLRDGGRCDLPQ